MRILSNANRTSGGTEFGQLFTQWVEQARTGGDRHAVGCRSAIQTAHPRAGGLCDGSTCRPIPQMCTSFVVAVQQSLGHPAQVDGRRACPSDIADSRQEHSDDPALLRVEAPVRESLAVRLTVGDTLQVDVPALEEEVEGRIDEIVPFAERGARTMLVKVSVPRTDGRLFAGMFARVGVPGDVRARLLVPEAAIERVGQLDFVRVLGEGGALERRLVTTGGPAAGGRVEVLSGLRGGERVSVGVRAVGVD